LASGDTITITLPAGVFSGTPALTTGSFTGQPLTSGAFTLTVGAGVSIAVGAVPNIVITGMTASPQQFSPKLTVKTSKDPNDAGIAITGI
jgi:hypothetical protein